MTGRFGNETNYLIATDHGIIMDVEATPARLSQEVNATKAMPERSAKGHDFKPDRIAADGSYRTYMPVPGRKHQRNGKYDISHFRYDANRDELTCLEGHEMPLRGVKENDRIKSEYAGREIHGQGNMRAGKYAGKQTCGACLPRKACTDAPFRTVTRHMDEDARESRPRRKRSRCCSTI